MKIMLEQLDCQVVQFKAQMFHNISWTPIWSVIDIIELLNSCLSSLSLSLSLSLLYINT